MPHCQNCNDQTPAEELIEHPAAGTLLCSECKNPEIQPLIVMGRELDYELSYSRRNGIQASARLGKASINLHVPQEELIKVFG